MNYKAAFFALRGGGSARFQVYQELRTAPTSSDAKGNTANPENGSSQFHER
jgi:hypothetical protein